MSKRVINKLKTKFLNLFSNKSNKKTSESPEIIKQKIDNNEINEFGYPSELKENYKQIKKSSPIYFKKF